MTSTIPTLISFLVLVLFLTNPTTAQQQVLTLESNSQSVPSNALLLLTDIGEESSSLLRCLTNRSDCCDAISTGSTGIGNWVSPLGANLSSLADTPTDVDLYQDRRPRGVDLLRRNSATSPEGIYRCDIPSSSNQTDMVYVGLYLEGNGEQE